MDAPQLGRSCRRHGSELGQVRVAKCLIVSATIVFEEGMVICPPTRELKLMVGAISQHHAAGNFDALPSDPARLFRA